MRKQTLFARRLRGDIGPLGIDPVRRLMSRIIAPAVSLTGVYQDYDEQDTTQNFTLGSRMVVDERVFHYARAGAPLVAPCTYRLSINADLHTSDSWGMVTGGITEGERTIRVIHADFGEVATTVDEDELVGGWIQYEGGGHIAWRRITANTESVLGTPAYIDITVDRPWPATVAGAGTCALHRNIYRNTRCAYGVGGYDHHQSANGLAPIFVAQGSFFWLQTWGPCFIAAGPGGSPGSVADHRDVYMWQDGEVSDFHTMYNAGAMISPQRIGYVMGASTLGEGNDDIMLQLAP